MQNRLKRGVESMAYCLCGLYKRRKRSLEFYQERLEILWQGYADAATRK